MLGLSLFNDAALELLKVSLPRTIGDDDDSRGCVRTQLPPVVTGELCGDSYKSEVFAR